MRKSLEEADQSFEEFKDCLEEFSLEGSSRSKSLSESKTVEVPKWNTKEEYLATLKVVDCPEVRTQLPALN